jgi:gliding motility-associated-like protein
LVSAIASSTNVTCFGLSNGGAAVSVIGGTGSYSYVWSPGGQTTATLTNVPADSYTVNIQDTNGCLNSVSTSISQPTALLFNSPSFTNTSCFGGNNGQISTSATGGTPGYTYSWLPSGSGSVLAGLAAGGYTVTVSDVNNCNTSAAFTISSPTALSASYVPTPATCNLANGSATLTVSGGTPIYNVNWTTPGTPTGLIAGNIPVGTSWSANITDSKGCTLTQTIGIASGPTPAIIGFNIVPPTCFGLSNGTITINYSSTTAPYNVTWSNPLSQTTSSSALTQNVSGAASGVYTATLTDGTGCSVSASTVVTQPSSLTLITSANASICFGNATQISATAGGGAGAYTYTWTPNVGTGGGPHTVNPIGLNSYAVVASDVNGCLTSQKIITISVGSPLSAQGFAVTKCDGETAVLTPNITSSGNNGPYNFLWSTGQSNVGVFASSLNVTANVLSATNTYTVFIDDGCSIPSASASFTVNVNAGPIIDFTGIPLKGCAPLTVTLTGTSNGVNDVFTWNADKVQSGGFGSPYIVTFQDSGKYSITLNVTNPTTGCSSSITKVDYIEAYPLPIASFFTDPQSTVIIDPNFNFINTSQGATSYFWNFGDLNTSISSNTSIVKNPSHAYSYVGTYEVNLVATSIKGCRDIATIIVEVTPDFSLYIPNTFTPDGNGLNDVFQPLGVGINEDKYRMDIYDRWGENIFTSTEFKKGWDGFVNGGSKAAPQGVYTYKILVADLLGNQYAKIGHVTVIKQE